MRQNLKIQVSQENVVFEAVVIQKFTSTLLFSWVIDIKSLDRIAILHIRKALQTYLEWNGKNYLISNHSLLLLL